MRRSRVGSAWSVEMGARLAQLRAGRLWTQKELAARAHCDDNYLSKLERGERVPSPSLRRRLMEALEVDGAILRADVGVGEAPERVARRMSNEELAAELARREGIAEDAIAATEMVLPPDAPPLRWLDQMRIEDALQHRARPRPAIASSRGFATTGVVHDKGH